MKLLKKFRLGALLGLGLVALTGSAQTATNAAPRILPERTGRVLPPPTGAPVPAGPVTDVRPVLAERPTLPQETRDLLYRFERVREAYLAEQKQLRQQYRGATDDEARERIRQLMRDRREAWLEQARQFREEAKERIIELKDALPQHGEVLDAARERAREKLNEARERRGTD